MTLGALTPAQQKRYVSNLRALLDKLAEPRIQVRVRKADRTYGDSYQKACQERGRIFQQYLSLRRLRERWKAENAKRLHKQAA